MSDRPTENRVRPPSWLRRHLKRIGVLRSAWTVGIVLTVFCAPFSRVDADYEGWTAITSLVAPVLATISIFVLLLDILMCQVFSLEKPPEARQDYRYIMRSNGVLLGLVVLSWLPFAVAIFGG